LDHANVPEWHEAMVAANIDFYEMSYEELVAYFKQLVNLEKIKKTNSQKRSARNMNYGLPK
jgi:hypothetical protein